jgi:hypothetical protein
MINDNDLIYTTKPDIRFILRYIIFVIITIFFFPYVVVQFEQLGIELILLALIITILLIYALIKNYYILKEKRIKIFIDKMESKDFKKQNTSLKSNVIYFKDIKAIKSVKSFWNDMIFIETQKFVYNVSSDINSKELKLQLNKILKTKCEDVKI